ncbi:flagellar hook-basal body complex protein [Rhodobacteraceae bacterium XHP0102]|nr:flagellar hook-basal body complex protein [Rhodobacteraceae bacterium XHP0102]
MSFFTALSGLKAAQTDISSTSNNIANVATLGYHGSRVEFSDIYTSSPQANPRTSVGSGVQISRISRSFAQGSMTSTQNTLDMAIQGAGFFRVEAGKEGGAAVYTRAGAFGMDNEGFVVNSKGQYLTGYKTAADGSPLNLGTAAPLQVPLKQGTAKATANLSFGASFPVGVMGQAGQATVPPAAFDPTNAQSYAFATPLNLLDPEGQPMDAVGYFALADTPDLLDPATRYQFHLVVNGIEVAPDAAAAGETLLEFDADGFLVGGGAPEFTFEGRPLAFDLRQSQLDAARSAMQVSTMQGDGEVARKLSMMELDGDGVLWASISGSRPRFGRNSRMAELTTEIQL